MPRGRVATDMTGQRHGRLVLLELVGAKSKKATWLARCDCGAECIVVGHAVRQGVCLSCGCLRRENTRALGLANTRHGLTDSPAWRSWHGALERCSNPKSPGWKYYGGRGISVCERWSSFANFLADMGPRPTGLSIDRIDNNGNYEPGNCRWATITQQNQNKRPGGRRRTS